MEFAQLLQELTDELYNSKKLLLKRTKAVDTEKCLELIDKLKTVMPEQIEQAEVIIQAKDKTIRRAEEQAANIIKEAQERAAQLTDENTIMSEAEERGNELIDNARQQAREIKMSARQFADDLMANMEDFLRDYLSQITLGRDQLNMRRRENDVKPQTQPPQQG